MQNTIRTTALLFVIMVISLCTTSTQVKDLPVGFIAVSLGLNYILMVYFGFKLKRFKAWLYPVMFVVNPFFNWVYMVYGIFTAGQRTWGGPRADAGAAGLKTSPQEAIEHAIATGDDLNVIPETFRPAVEVRKRHGRTSTIGLQPPEAVQGRFVPAAEQAGGWFKQVPLSGSLPQEALQTSRSGTLEDGYTSDFSDSDGVSLHTPRRLTSILADEEWQRREKAQSEPVAAYDSDDSGDSVESHHDATTGLTIYGKPSRGQYRRERAIKSAGADPYELSNRLTDLQPTTTPQARFDGTRSLTLHRSPLGRTSPMRPAGEVEAIGTHGDNLHSQSVAPKRMFSLYGRAKSGDEAKQSQGSSGPSASESRQNPSPGRVGVQQ